MTDGAQIEYYIWDRKLKMNHVAQVLGISTSTLKNKLTGKQISRSARRTPSPRCWS